MFRVSLRRTFLLLSLAVLLSQGSPLVQDGFQPPTDADDDISMSRAADKDQTAASRISAVAWDWESSTDGAVAKDDDGRLVSNGWSYRRWNTLDDPVTTTTVAIVDDDPVEPSSVVASPSASKPPATSLVDPALNSQRLHPPPPSMETRLVFQPKQPPGKFYPAAGKTHSPTSHSQQPASFPPHLPSHPKSPPCTSPPHSTSPSFESLRVMALRSPQPNVSLAYLQNLMESQEVASSAFQIPPQRAKPMPRARNFDARFDLGDTADGDSLLDATANFWDQLTQLTAEVSPIYSEAQLPKVPDVKLRQMQFFASVSAAAYCMSWNVYPRWKCGYPRCSHPSLGAFNQTEEQDVLAGTESMLYFKGHQSGMVGFVALNDHMDMGYSTGELAHPDWHHSVVMVAFRGTMNIKNFIFDLRFAQVVFQYPGAPKTARVHSGFWEIWKDCESMVKDGLRKAVDLTLARHQGHKVHLEVVISGHSLGGAVALLGALGFRQDIMEHKRFPGVGRSMTGYNLIRLGKHERERSLVFWFGEDLCVSFKLYTFGEPRVGNTVFAKWLADLEGLPLFRTTYFNDPIPHLPPRKLLPIERLQFHHHAAEFHIKKDKDETVSCGHSDGGDGNEDNNNDDDQLENSHIGEDPACSSGVRSLNLLSHLTYWHVFFGPWC